MPRNEQQTRTELINPVLYEKGWVDALIREEKTPGGIDIVDGKSRKRKGRTDYLLCIPVIDGKPPLPIALLEAKAEDKLPSLGIQQAKDYMKKFNVPFVFSTNGHLYAEYAEDTGQIADALPLTAFPTPHDLRQRYEQIKGLQLTSDSMKPLLMPYKGGEAARYYFQDAAIRATFEKIANGNKKVLLSLATGTGKTIIAAQLLYKLAQAGQLKRALFVCDRDELRTQGNAKLHGIFGDNVQIVTTQDPQKNARILVATYQTLNVTEEFDEPKFWKENYPKNYFSHIIIDECHRSAWGKWSVILKDNPDAVQIGLTATPRIVIGGKKVNPEDIEEQYTAKDYEMKLMLDDRVKAMSEDLFQHFLSTGGPRQKTIIFCARDNHANQIMIALNNVYEKWCKENNRSPKERYAFQCTGNPDLRPSADKLIPDFRGAKNSHFIATTVELLSTGVDIPNLDNVVFFRYLESPISFYQMVGRGTRTGEPRGSKAMFRVYDDYTNTTRLFGEVFISRAKPSKPEKEPPEGTESPLHTYGKEDVPKRKIIRVGEHQFTVQIQGEGRSILCVEDGKEVLIPVEEYKQQLAEKVVEEAPSIDALRQTWITPEKRIRLLVNLPGGESAVRLLRELEDEQECDLFDVLAELGYNIPPKSRNERVAAFSYKNKTWLRGFPERTGKVLMSVARQLEKGGIEELETTNLFDEEEIVKNGGFDALLGVKVEPQSLIQETKSRLLA